jgi:hypothetical protein
METERKRCVDLVGEKMWERSSQIEELNDILEDEEKTTEEHDEAFYELENLPLEISAYRIVKVLFSTGGPGDWIEIKVNDYEEVLGVTYHYQDWFDHAEIKVPDNSYLWDYAIKLVDGLDIDQL